MKNNIDVYVERYDYSTGPEVKVRLSDCRLGGFYFSAFVTPEEALRLRDALTAVLEPPVQIPAEIVSEWERIDNAPRNPLSLGDDALGENESPIAQADGDPGDCHLEKAA